ncbi:GPI-anchored surface protein, putative [Bodo saltans]|uniref:GPI-anchored surface protein, putative n=1 Tax=Bodo saltans TaxID=75058 RepID=A0A0S4JPZ9_BODSA|nr:GPI-anchored surface protein, putative [Bodo saltans]|eukprot:CUG93613.1 GPI-anchored surface protein, putative [Bodo saltans]
MNRVRAVGMLRGFFEGASTSPRARAGVEGRDSLSLIFCRRNAIPAAATSPSLPARGPTSRCPRPPEVPPNIGRPSSQTSTAGPFSYRCGTAKVDQAFMSVIIEQVILSMGPIDMLPLPHVLRTLDSLSSVF